MNALLSSRCRAVLLLTLCAFAFAPLACDSSGSDDAKTCTLSAGPNSKDVPLTVEYTATLTGDAEIRELTYTTNDGEQTVNGITSNWSETVDVDSGVEVEITATAEVPSGRAEIGYFGQDAEGNDSIEESDACDVNSD